MPTRDAVEFRISADNLRVEGEECLYLLPQGFVDSIISIQDRLRWKATWEEDDGSRANLTDDELQIVEKGITRLCNPMDIINNITVENDGGGGSGSGCCCGGDGAPSPVFPNPFPETNPTVPPSGVPEDDGSTNPDPDEFSSYEEYRDYKCRVATQIVDDVTETIGNLQTLGGLVAVGAGYAAAAMWTAGTYSAIVVGLAAIGLSATGGVILIATALVALIVFGAVIFDHFNDIHDYMVENRNDLICGVFNAQNETQVKQVFYDIMQAAVANLTVETDVQSILQRTVNDIIDALVPSEVVIMLFRFFKDVGIEAFDCSTCADISGQFIAFTGNTSPVLPANWTGTLPNYGYNSGIRDNAGGYDACTNDGFCEDATYFSKSGIQIEFDDVDGRLEIRSCRQSNFPAPSQVRVLISSGQVHQQTLAAAKYAPATEEITYDFVSGTSYTLIVESTNTSDDRLIISHIDRVSV